MSSGYQKKYEEYAKKFWDLQQLEQTEEEKKFDELCQKLEEMITSYRAEITELEDQNLKLQSKVDHVNQIKEEYEALKLRESQLQRLKNEMNIP